MRDIFISERFINLFDNKQGERFCKDMKNAKDFHVKEICRFQVAISSETNIYLGQQQELSTSIFGIINVIEHLRQVITLHSFF